MRKKSNEGKKKKGVKRQHHEDYYDYSCTRVQALVSSQGRTLSQPKRHSNVLSLCVRVAHIQWVFSISVSCANSLEERESKVIKSCDNLFQHCRFLGAHLICPPQNLNLRKKMHHRPTTQFMVLAQMSPSRIQVQIHDHLQWAPSAHTSYYSSSWLDADLSWRTAMFRWGCKIESLRTNLCFHFCFHLHLLCRTEPWILQWFVQQVRQRETWTLSSAGKQEITSREKKKKKMCNLTITAEQKDSM